MLGRIQPEHFPQVFGPGGDQPLDAAIVAGKFAALARRIAATTAGAAARAIQGSAGRRARPEQVAAGFLEIAVANMANAIKKISVQRGYDVTQYVLATFGGAGGQHACAVADALGMTRVLIHPLAGVLSAYGMGLADVTAMRETGGGGTAVRPACSRELDTGGRRAGRRRARRAGGRGDRAGPGPRPCAAPTCGTRAPTPRCRSRSARWPQMISRLRGRRTGSTSRSSCATRRSSWRRCRWSCDRGGCACRTPPAGGPPRARAGGRPGSHPFGCMPAASGRTCPWSRRTDLRPGQAGGRARADRGGLRDHGGRARLAGGGDRARRPAADPGDAAAGAAGGRDRGRTRSCWRSSTTCSCRSPSRWACGCGRPRTRSTSRSGSTSPARSSTPTAGSSPTRRTSRCTSGSMGESITIVASRNAGPDAARRRLRAQRPLPRRHAPARRHGGHPGVRRVRRRDLVLRRLPRAPRRDRRDHARLDARVQHPGRGGGGADRQLAAGARRGAARGARPWSCSARPSTRPATPASTWPTCARRSPPTRKGVQELRRA